MVYRSRETSQTGGIQTGLEFRKEKTGVSSLGILRERSQSNEDVENQSNVAGSTAWIEKEELDGRVCLNISNCRWLLWTDDGMIPPCFCPMASEISIYFHNQISFLVGEYQQTALSTCRLVCAVIQPLSQHSTSAVHSQCDYVALAAFGAVGTVMNWPLFIFLKEMDGCDIGM